MRQRMQFLESGIRLLQQSLADTNTSYAVVGFGNTPVIYSDFKTSADLRRLKYTAFYQKAGLEAIRMALNNGTEMLCFESEEDRVPRSGRCALNWRRGAKKLIFLATDGESDLPVLQNYRLPGQEEDSFCRDYLFGRNIRNCAASGMRFKPGFTPYQVDKASPQPSGSRRTVFQMFRSGKGLKLTDSYEAELEQTSQLLNQHQATLFILVSSNVGSDLTPFLPVSSFGPSNAYWRVLKANDPSLEADFATVALYQYGSPALNVHHGNLSAFDGQRTLMNLTRAGLERSLQARLLSAGQVSRVFEIDIARNETSMHAVFQQLADSVDRRACTGNTATSSIGASRTSARSLTSSSVNWRTATVTQATSSSRNVTSRTTTELSGSTAVRLNQTIVTSTRLAATSQVIVTSSSTPLTSSKKTSALWSITVATENSVRSSIQTVSSVLTSFNVDLPRTDSRNVTWATVATPDLHTVIQETPMTTQDEQAIILSSAQFRTTRRADGKTSREHSSHYSTEAIVQTTHSEDLLPLTEIHRSVMTTAGSDEESSVVNFTKVITTMSHPIPYAEVTSVSTRTFERVTETDDIACTYASTSFTTSLFDSVSSPSVLTPAAKITESIEVETEVVESTEVRVSSQTVLTTTTTAWDASSMLSTLSLTPVEPTSTFEATLTSFFPLSVTVLETANTVTHILGETILSKVGTERSETSEQSRPESAITPDTSFHFLPRTSLFNQTPEQTQMTQIISATAASGQSFTAVYQTTKLDETRITTAASSEPTSHTLPKHFTATSTMQQPSTVELSSSVTLDSGKTLSDNHAWDETLPAPTNPTQLRGVSGTLLKNDFTSTQLMVALSTSASVSRWTSTTIVASQTSSTGLPNQRFSERTMSLDYEQDALATSQAPLYESLTVVRISATINPGTSESNSVGDDGSSTAQIAGFATIGLAGAGAVLWLVKRMRTISDD